MPKLRTKYVLFRGMEDTQQCHDSPTNHNEDLLTCPKLQLNAFIRDYLLVCLPALVLTFDLGVRRCRLCVLDLNPRLSSPMGKGSDCCVESSSIALAGCSAGAEASLPVSGRWNIFHSKPLSERPYGVDQPYAYMAGATSCQQCLVAAYRRFLLRAWFISTGQRFVLSAFRPCFMLQHGMEPLSVLRVSLRQCQNHCASQTDS
ncbi:uncharacterized protein C8Q71DRAFT_742160 [Rhodofomes roseus]|uniref:Uncharacterized protein n=1 Tax=Rhodofomes roseus TaxID=34475 RepID=A0ABQ8KRB7_9APHY|nr:uncharacterized protein C8Q71DRAFT_742160 [Rhodofomes roseus]KAH9840902.1 hypothetical protein C8Q71DRAFT_742160 [Rhodofomes roseus]